MDNTQVTARDGSWFLFADWQGMTRISLPGGRIKTDANLDRPHQDKPLVLRPEGQVWSSYALDIDPVALKKTTPVQNGHNSPDPLGGPEIAVGTSGDTVSVRGHTLRLEASGDELQLGGVPSRRKQWGEMRYNIYPDHAIVVYGAAARQTQVGLVLRAAEGTAHIAWCRPTAQVPCSSPDAFRGPGSTWLADRDPRLGIAHLIEIRDDGKLQSTTQTPAVAGPWVHDGQVWWQPDDTTLCAGPALGESAQSYTLSAEHAGPGRLLRLPGRKLFLPWHGVSILDLAPAKKGKSELSRKHKAAEEPLYREAERLLLPLRAGLGRRDACVTWRGCTRYSRSLEPSAIISGHSDLVTYILGYAIREGIAAKLASTGAGSVECMGAAAYDSIFAPAAPTTAQDIRDLIGMLDAAGLSRATAFGSLHSLAKTAAQRKLSLPLTPEAEDLALAAVLSGLRHELTGLPLEPIAAIAPATAESIELVAPLLRDDQRLRKAGINGSQVASFINVTGHRRFGARAVATTHEALIAMSPTYADDVAEALGQPVPERVSPPVEQPPLTPQEATIVAELESVLARDFAVDPAESRNGQGWYRFHLDNTPFQAGISGIFHVQATLCATATDLDMNAVARSLATANKGLVGASFEESDCYLHACASCRLDEATAAKLKAMIEVCRAAIASPKGQSLHTKYRTYD